MGYRKLPNATPLKKEANRQLTHKQQLFVKEYVVCLNAAEACRRAGYQAKNANRIGTELLHHPLIRAQIDAHIEKKSKRLELSADYVVQKLISIVEETEKDNPQAALRGLELIGKHLGMYKDRQEISGPDGGAIEMEQRVKEDVADFTSKLSRLAESNGAAGVSIFPKSGSSSGS